MIEALNRPLPVPQSDPIGNAIAVASGKGGVGKTWVSISLAQALAKLGQHVLLFDGDLGLANIDIQLGISPAVDLGTALDRQMSLGRAVTAYPTGGFDLIAGRSGSGSLANLPAPRLQALADGLKELSRNYTRVVIDLGAGIERPVRYFAGRSKTCLIVTTDEPTALTDAYALIKMLSADGVATEIGVVVNMATSRETGQRTYQTLAKACDTFLKRQVPLMGVIRRDPKVKESIRAQTPLLVRFPSSPAALDIEALAKRMIE